MKTLPEFGKHYYCCFDQEGQTVEPWLGVLREAFERRSDRRLPLGHVVKADGNRGTPAEYAVELSEAMLTFGVGLYATEDEAWANYIHLLGDEVRSLLSRASLQQGKLLLALHKRHNISQGRLDEDRTAGSAVGGLPDGSTAG